MKILKIVLILVGVLLVGLGLYDALVPRDIVEVGPLKVSATEGLNNQTIAMIILGVLALIAGAFIKKRT